MAKLKNRPPSRNKPEWKLAIENISGVAFDAAISVTRKLKALPYHGPFLIKRTVAYDESDSAISLLTPDTGYVVKSVFAKVSTAFDGNPSLNVGDGENEQGFLVLDNVALGKTGWYGYNSQYSGEYLMTEGYPQQKVYDDTTNRPFIGFNAGSATQGSVTVYLEYLNMEA